MNFWPIASEIAVFAARSLSRIAVLMAAATASVGLCHQAAKTSDSVPGDDS